MELWASLGILLCGIGLGAGVCWVLLRGTLAHLRADLGEMHCALEARAVELNGARAETDTWRASTKPNSWSARGVRPRLVVWEA